MGNIKPTGNWYNGLSLRKVSAALAQRGFQARTGAQFHPGQIQRMIASSPTTLPAEL
jgi:hypothetical protein